MNFDEIIKESTEKKEQKLYQQQINLEESRQKLSNETTIEELKRQIDRLEQEKELIKLQREKKLKKMLLVWLVVCILGVMTNGGMTIDFYRQLNTLHIVCTILLSK